VSAQSTLIAAVALLASGATMLLAAAALAFEGGMVADATGGVGSLSVVESLLWIAGPILALVGVILLLIARRAGNQPA
jgi:hypothetical protein